MDRYVLCNDGTRIYFHLGRSTAAVRCESCGDLGNGDEGGMWIITNAHASAHGGKHSVT